MSPSLLVEKNTSSLTVLNLRFFYIMLKNSVLILVLTLFLLNKEKSVNATYGN